MQKKQLNALLKGVNTQLLVVAIGSAVGLGNIWKFPYITNTQGGGVFVLVYLLCIAAIGFPLLIGELILGDRIQRGLLHTPTKLQTIHLSGVKKIGGLIAFLILSFYSVVAGWSIAYFVEFVKAVFDAAYQPISFSTFSENPYPQAGFHLLIICISILVVGNGIQMMEKIVKGLLIAFVVLLFMLSIGSMIVFEEQMPSVFRFLFSPDSWRIGQQGVLEAVGHAFFTLSLASGIILIFGQNFTPDKQIVRSSFFIAGADTLIALMACLLIFPIIFAMKGGTEFTDSSGILFTAINELLSGDAASRLLGALFFLLVSFAALTSVFSLLHASTSIFEHNLTPILVRIKSLSSRKKGPSYHFLATVAIGILAAVMGILCAFSNSSTSTFSDMGTGTFVHKTELKKNYLEVEEVKGLLPNQYEENTEALIQIPSNQAILLQHLGKKPDEREGFAFTYIPTLKEVEISQLAQKEVKSFMGLCMHFSTNWLLPISGLILSLFIGFFLPESAAKPYFEGSPDWFFVCWKGLVRYLIPTIILGILLINLLS